MYGADIKHSDHDGQTALLHAAQCLGPDAVELLLQSGADITHIDHEGRTTLFWALRYGHVNSIELLRSSGAAISGEKKKKKARVFARPKIEICMMTYWVSGTKPVSEIFPDAAVKMGPDLCIDN